jgi:uroporphyrinogen-III synthase
MPTGTLAGARVGILEGRGPALLADLVRRWGGEPRVAPALREVPLDASAQIEALLDALSADEVQVVIFLTGVGAAGLLEGAGRLGRLPELVAGLSRTTNVCPGQKPWRPLKEHGIPISVTVPSPYTTAEVLRTLDEIPLAGRGVALLHYGERSAALADALTGAGARLLELCLYEWRLPEDTAPLAALVGEVIAGELEAVVFTTQVQVRHLLAVAEASGRKDELVEALGTRTVVAAVGPTTAATAEAAGIRVGVVPSNPKMGPMIAALAGALGGGAGEPLSPPDRQQPSD